MIVQTQSFVQSDCPSHHADVFDCTEKSSRVLSKKNNNISLQGLLKKDLGRKPFVQTNSVEPSLQNPMLGRTKKLPFSFANKANCRLCNPRCEGFFWKPFYKFATSLVIRNANMSEAPWAVLSLHMGSCVPVVPPGERGNITATSKPCPLLMSFSSCLTVPWSCKLFGWG